MGTPASCIRRRASVLSPIALMADGGGPTKTRPAAPPPRQMRLARPGNHTRVDRLGTGLPGGVNQAFDGEVALGRCRWSNGNRMICRAHMRRGSVRTGIHRHRLETLFMTGADDAERDLSAIGDEDAFHRRTGKTGRTETSGSEGCCVATRQGRHAGGGESPNTGSKLLQSRLLNRAARSYTTRTSLNPDRAALAGGLQQLRNREGLWSGRGRLG